MPGEHITLYLKTAPEEPVVCDRTAYYDSVFETYQDHYPAVIDVFLFNRYGDMLLQKRSRLKRIQPGKLHTSVGGHINWGEQAEFCVIHECMEELGAAALTFTKERYAAAMEKLAEHTHKAAILCEMGEYFRDHRNDPILERQDIKDRVWIYFGRYDGPIEIPDRDSAGYEWISLPTLIEEFQTHPNQFTSGLKLFIETFGDQMETFIQTFCPE